MADASQDQERSARLAQAFSQRGDAQVSARYAALAQAQGAQAQQQAAQAQAVPVAQSSFMQAQAQQAAADQAYQDRVARIQRDLEQARATYGSPSGTLAEIKAAQAALRQAEQRANAQLRDARNARASAQQQARTEYVSSVPKVSPGTDYVSGAQGNSKAQNAQIRQDVREAFVASGRSAQASPQEYQRAVRDEVRKGNLTLTTAEGTPLRVEGSQLVGVQPVRNPVGQATPPRVSAQVSVGEAIRSSRTAGEAFAKLGAPQRQVVGKVTFGRTPAPTVGDVARKVLGLNVPARADEPSRETTVYREVINVPDAASARFAGFPSAGTFEVLTVENRDVAQDTILGVQTPRFVRTLEASAPGKFVASSVQAAQAVERSANEGVVAFSQLPVAKLTPFPGIIAAGNAIANAGEAVQAQGERVEARNPVVAFSQPEGTPAQRVVQAARADAQNAANRFARTEQFVGGALKEEGSRLATQPVTAGAETAVLFGIGAGALDVGIEAIRASELAQEASAAGRVVRASGTTLRVAQVGGEVVLATAFAANTAVAVQGARTPAQKGAVLAGAATEAVAFGAGVKVGGSLASGVGSAVSAADRALFEKQTVISPEGEVLGSSRELKPEFRLDRRGEVGGRSAQERSGSRTKGQLRNPGKGLRQSAPKYEVARTPEEITFSLRGQARARTEDIRILEAGVSRTEFQRGKFFREVNVEGIGAKVNIPVGRIKDVALPGEPSPRIVPPEGRVRAQSAQVQFRTTRDVAGDISEGVAQDRRARFRNLNREDRPKMDIAEARKLLGPGRAPQEAVVEARPVFKPVKVGLEQPGVPARTEQRAAGPVRRSLSEVFQPRRARFVAQVVEEVPSEGLAQERPEQATFFLGSPRYREAKTLIRLHELAAAREAQVRAQLPARLQVGPRAVAAKGRAPGELGFRQGGARGLPAGLAQGSASRFQGLAREAAKVQALGRAQESSVLGVLAGVQREQGQEQFSRQRQSYAVQSVHAQEQALAQAQARALRVEAAQAQAQRQELAQEARQETRLETPREPLRGAALGLGSPDAGKGPREPRGVPEGRRGRGREAFGIPDEPATRKVLGGGFQLKGRRLGLAGYRLAVRRRGRLESQGVFTQEEAQVLGAKLVDNSPAQTFTLERVGEAPQNRAQPSGAEVARALRDFSGKATQGGFKYRERQRALINSGGELSGITRLGIAASARARRRR